VVAAVQQQPKAPENDLFTLDFHTPAAPTATSPEPKKDVKQDILSLFSAPVAAAPAAPFNQFNQAAHWGGGVPQQQPVQQPQPPAMTGMMGSNGPGMWGVSSGWSGAPAIPPQPNVWGAPAQVAPSIPQQQMNMFNTNAVWGAPTPAAAAPATGADLFGSFSAPTPSVQQKDDAFGDIWGGFK
jgi:stromal membrane-associated protein